MCLPATPRGCAQTYTVHMNPGVNGRTQSSRRPRNTENKDGVDVCCAPCWSCVILLVVHVVIRVAPKKAKLLHLIYSYAVISCYLCVRFGLIKFVKLRVGQKNGFRMCASRHRPRASVVHFATCIYIRDAFVRRSTPRRTATTRSVPMRDVSLFRMIR